MTRAEIREVKRRIQNEIKEFLKIQAHYFPNLIQDIKKVMDGRNQSYITYGTSGDDGHLGTYINCPN